MKVREAEAKENARIKDKAIDVDKKWEERQAKSKKYTVKTNNADNSKLSKEM